MALAAPAVAKIHPMLHLQGPHPRVQNPLKPPRQADPLVKQRASTGRGRQCLSPMLFVDPKEVQLRPQLLPPFPRWQQLLSLSLNRQHQVPTNSELILIHLDPPLSLR